MVKWAMPVTLSVVWTSIIIVHGFPTTAEGPLKPVSAPLDPKLNPIATDLPESDASFKKPDKKFQPEQISVSLSYNYDSVWISWVTGEFQVGEDIVPLDSVMSLVRYREYDGSKYKYATGYSVNYSRGFDSRSLHNYTSGIIHHAQLTGLKPKTLYQYQCGDPSLSAMSEAYLFRTMPDSMSEDYPSRIVVAANLGLTYNSSQTWDHMLIDHPELVVLVGGFSHADTYRKNGTKLSCPSGSLNGTCQANGQETYQPRWDYWGRFMETLIGNVPTMLVAGEHEVEREVDDRKFVSYSSRFAFPSNESRSFTPLYYSFNAGGIHFVMINAYAPYDNSSDQYRWMENDLKNVNRSETPWVAMAWTSPWYSTFKDHYRTAEPMRNELETLLYNYRVDVVFNGEVDAYERSNRVYNYELDPCGPVYITVGAGGSGKLAVDHMDGAGHCPDNTMDCLDRQPAYSAYRESSFGLGMLEVKNETHALWSWIRNQDAYFLARDMVYIVRQPELCPVHN